MKDATPERIIDVLIAEWPSGLAAPLGRVREAIRDLRRELAAARAALLATPDGPPADRTPDEGEGVAREP